MPRFLKGTTDHDNDGKMGGSNPQETDMTKTPKKPAAKAPAAETEAVDTAPEADPVKAKKAKVAEQFAEADAKTDPAVLDEQALADLQVQRSVRGW